MPQESTGDQSHDHRQQLKFIPLVLGPLLALIVYFLLPDQYLNTAGQYTAFTQPARACTCVVLWMAIWWFTEAVPIAATALLPIVLFPLFGIASSGETLRHYSSGTIFLFLGGFLIAAGIIRWGLDRRIALLTIRLVGTKPQQIVLGIMLATAFLSAWVSNTATAAMMIPIAVAVLGVVRSTRGIPQIDQGEHNFGVCLLLSIAYGASLGGILTLIGTPPNGIFVRFVEQTYGVQVSFFEWMKISLPVIVVMLLLTYVLLVKILFRKTIDALPGGREWVRSELQAMGPLSRGEKIVLTVFVAVAIAWVLGPVLRGFEIDGMRPFKTFTDSTIAMTGGLLLFIIPVDFKHGIHALDWKTANKAVAWDVLLLFGGGLSMAAAIQSTGTADVVGALALSLANLPEWAIVTGVNGIAVFASGVTSNTALAATMMPLVVAVADSLKLHPEALLICTTMGASCAFMTPVGTPPNAMVFGTGRIRMSEMIWAGFWLNIISIIVVSSLVLLLSGDLLAHIPLG